MPVARRFLQVRWIVPIGLLLAIGVHAQTQPIVAPTPGAASTLPSDLPAPAAATLPSVLPAPATPQPARTISLPDRAPIGGILPEYRGRKVEEVRVVGNTAQVQTAVILNVVRTHEGDAFEPKTVEDDYERIYDLKKFANVEARVEATDHGGVIVTFVVSESRLVKSVSTVGNREISTLDLQQAVDVRAGDAIDPFRISVGRQAIEELYRAKNYPFAQVAVDQDTLAKTGDLVFRVNEGPEVRIRKVDFKGNNSFTADKLKDQIRTSSWIFIFRAGTFNEEEIDDDVSALRRFYQGKGFFDVKVGRKVLWSADLSEVQVNFVINEGPRYVVDEVTFKGNTRVSEADLHSRLKLVEGKSFDVEALQRDTHEVVKAYSPYGFIYQPQSTNPDFLRIDTKNVFRLKPGHMELVYEISEGKPFHMGQIRFKGNAKTQDKVLAREMHVQPGQLYNSAELQDAADRLRGTPYFKTVTITPIGDDPDFRDVLVDVNENTTATFSFGAGINSNGGVGGNITYEQRNFDLGAPPANFRDFFSDRSFTGAGQTLRLSLEPGTQATNASALFAEPYLFDQPYSFSEELYLRDRDRVDYTEQRVGDRIAFGKRFNYIYSGQIGFRGEDVDIKHIQDPTIRAPEIIDNSGHTTLTSATLSLRRNTTNAGILPYKGTNTVAAWESYGVLGGQVYMQKYTLSFDAYHELSEDLQERKTILRFYADAGYIAGNSIFFERFYGGGIGSLRGFKFRGVSPRQGLDDDAIGGDFTLTTGQEISFPLAGEQLRGVIFSDQGTVDPDVEFGTYRVSVGTGIRLVLPFLGQAPLSLDFAVPLIKADKDETQIISFSFGFAQ